MRGDWEATGDFRGESAAAYLSASDVSRLCSCHFLGDCACRPFPERPRPLVSVEFSLPELFVVERTARTRPLVSARASSFS